MRVRLVFVAWLALAVGCSGSSGPTPEGPACAAPLVACGDRCVELQADVSHCGACGSECTGGKACVGGACECVDGNVDCGGTCAFLAYNSLHCGACFHACTGGAACLAAVCQCAGGEVDCDGTCAALANDPAHCGACGNACTGGKGCVDGGCVCPADTVECDGVCSTLGDDPANCGACGNTCADGLRCLHGTCAGPVCDGTPLLPGPAFPPGFRALHGSTAADLDGDGKLDLVASARDATGANGVFLLAGHGDGTFAMRTQLAMIEEAGAVVVADLDGTGRPDVAVGVYELAGRAPGITLLFRDGAGGVDGVHFEWHLVYALAAADLDGDGDIDLAATGFEPTAGASLRFLRNDGGGAFSWAPTELEFGTIGALALGDVDGDGDTDVVGPCSDRNLGVWKNQGNFEFTAGWCGPLADTLGDVVLADLDDDGDLDFAVPGPKVAWNDGNGVPTDPFTWNLGGSGDGLAAADLEGDGDMDLLVAVSAPGWGALRVLRNDGHLLVPEQAIPIPPGVVSLTAADVNGDGAVDVVFSDDDGVEGVLDTLLSAEGSLRGRVRYAVPTGDWSWTALADLGGDGTLDAITIGRDTLAELRGPTPAGGPQQGTNFVGGELRGLAVGDLDGDGKADYGTAIPERDQLALVLSQGGRVFEDAAQPVALAFAEVDGDGAMDLVIAETEESLAVRVHWGDGFRPDERWNLAEVPLDLVAGDVDGDGRDEVLVVGETSLRVLGLDEHDALAEEDVFEFSTNAPRIADLDLDGRMEVIAPVVSAAEVRLLHVGEDGETTVGTARPPAAVAVADVNSDGWPDLLVLDERGLLQLFRGVETGAPAEVGTWVTGTESTGTGRSLALAAGDLGRNGTQDLVVLGPGGLVVIGSGCLP